jgi:hypothetical protein
MRRATSIMAPAARSCGRATAWGRTASSTATGRLAASVRCGVAARHERGRCIPQTRAALGFGVAKALGVDLSEEVVRNLGSASSRDGELVATEMRSSHRRRAGLRQIRLFAYKGHPDTVRFGDRALADRTTGP